MTAVELKSIVDDRLKEALRVKSSTTVVEYFNHLENAYLVQRLSRRLGLLAA